MEGDMSAMLKVIWNLRPVPAAIKSKMMHPVQLGNRKGRTALDALLFKIITMDTMQLFYLNCALLFQKLLQYINIALASPTMLLNAVY
eukprot:4801336-Ditylum_brightwellii.AAC.2